MASSSSSTSPLLSSKVAPETVGKAVDALLKWTKSRSKEEKPQLLEHDEFFYLILTLRKIPPKGRTNAYKIPLPHSLHPIDASEELCLIIDDRSKSSLSSDSAKKKIKAEDIPISKVLKLSKLKTDYRPFEAKRKLCDSFDMFFADKGIIPLLPKLLGKQFFKKKKIPVPVDLTRKNWKEQIERASSSALLYLKTGTCTVIKVGRVSQTRDEVVENVVAAIEGAAEIVPRKWGNVRSLHLKMSESLALPIYQAVPEIGLKIEGVKKEIEVVSGEQELLDEGATKEKEKKKVAKKKKVPKKGRIHEVRYMDDDLGEILNDVSDDNDGEKGTEIDDEPASAKLSSKKRKKADNDSIEKKKQLKKPSNKVKKSAKKADAEIHKDGSSVAEEKTDSELKKKNKNKTTSAKSEAAEKKEKSSKKIIK